MKLFLRFKNVCKNFGLHETQPFEKNQHWLNVKAFVVLFFTGQFVLSSMAYLVIEANTFREYANSFYLSTSFTATFIIGILFIWKAEQIFNVITNFEIAIQKRKCVTLL